MLQENSHPSALYRKSVQVHQFGGQDWLKGVSWIDLRWLLAPAMGDCDLNLIWVPQRGKAHSNRHLVGQVFLPPR